MADVVYPYHKYNFKVEITDKGELGFSEVSGGEMSMEPIEYREGQFTNSSAIKSQGIVKYSNVTLKYGLTDNKELYEWFNSAQTQTIEPKEVKIILLGDDHKEEKTSWTLTNAFPIKIALSDFNATGNEPAIESVELACDSIIRN